MGRESTTSSSKSTMASTTTSKTSTCSNTSTPFLTWRRRRTSARRSTSSLSSQTSDKDDNKYASYKRCSCSSSTSSSGGGTTMKDLLSSSSWHGIIRGRRTNKRRQGRGVIAAYRTQQSSLNAEMETKEANQCFDSFQHTSQELNAEMTYMSLTLEECKVENEELLYDTQMLLDENEHLTSDLRKTKLSLKACEKDKERLTTELEGVQFELEHLQERLLVHEQIKIKAAAITTDSTKSLDEKGDNPDSSCFSQSSTETSPSCWSTVPGAPMLTCLINSSDWHNDRDLQITIIHGLQSELVRKTRNWSEEKHVLEQELMKSNHCMRQMEDYVHRCVDEQTNNQETLERLMKLVQGCVYCRAKNDAYLNEIQERKDQLAEFRRRSDCMVMVDPKNNKDDDDDAQYCSTTTRSTFFHRWSSTLDESFTDGDATSEPVELALSKECCQTNMSKCNNDVANHDEATLTTSINGIESTTAMTHPIARSASACYQKAKKSVLLRRSTRRHHRRCRSRELESATTTTCSSGRMAPKRTNADCNNTSNRDNGLEEKLIESPSQNIESDNLSVEDEKDELRYDTNDLYVDFPSFNIRASAQVTHSSTFAKNADNDYHSSCMFDATLKREDAPKTTSPFDCEETYSFVPPKVVFESRDDDDDDGNDDEQQCRCSFTIYDNRDDSFF